MSVFLLILGLVLFIGLVVVHEWGHFIMAKRNGVEVEEFGIFFPPRLFKHKTKAGWVFTINALPLGGFVKLKGEHDTDTAKGSYGAASTWAKTKIMAAGVVMNLIVGVLLLLALGWLGTPVLVCNQFAVKQDITAVHDNRMVTASYVEPGSPASAIGIKQGDEILAAGSNAQYLQRVLPECDLRAVTTKFAGKPLTIQYKHHGKVITRSAQLISASAVAASEHTKNPKGYLGLATTGKGYAIERSTWAAPVNAIGLTGQFTQLTFQGLGKAIGGLGSLIAGAATHNTQARQSGQTEASSQVSGPVGVYEILKEVSAVDYRFMLLVIAIISLTLAIMNILPIPALDGGRLWLTLISRGLKRPLSPKREELINGIGFVLLLSLIVVITIVDVHRFF